MMPVTESKHCGDDLPAYVNRSLDPDRAAAVADHLVECAACRAEEDGWRAVSRATQTAFASGSAARGLLDRVWLEIDQQDEADRRPSVLAHLRRLPRALSAGFWAHPRSPSISSGRRLAAGVAAVACLLLAAFAGARADNLFDVFKPQQFAAVPVSLQDLQQLPDLANYGTLTTGGTSISQATTVDTPEAASGAAGFSVATPASLPAGVPAGPVYTILPGSSASFTFSAAKAAAAAAALGKTLPPMPAGLDGATLQLSSAPAVVAIYAQPSAGAGNPPAGEDVHSAIPVLVVGQTTAPKVVASGASAADIEHYLLSQPGISPQLAAAIRALGSPGDTWPVPIPVNLASSQPVQVQGVKGLAIGDSTGLGAGILWQKNGVVYAVAGTLSQQELLSVANALH